MLRKRGIGIIVCWLLCLTGACIFDEHGSGPADSGPDTDGDADGDSDGDADSDSDGDADGDSDGDADGDGDTDGDEDTPLVLESIEPSWGYTTGYVLDPRPESERIVDIRYSGGDGDVELLFNGEMLTTSCSEDLEEAKAGCIQHSPDGLFRIRYPESLVLESVPIVLRSGDEEVDGEFEYRLLPFELQRQTLETGASGSAAALRTGCFTHSGVCSDAIQDIAVLSSIPRVDDDAGMINIISAGTEGSRDASLGSAWTGPTEHAPLDTVTTAFTGGVTPRNGPPTVITYGAGTSWSMRLNRFDRSTDTFSVDPDVHCWNPSPVLTGLAAGDFNAVQSGYELVMMGWRGTDLAIFIMTTTVRECPTTATTADHLQTGTPPSSPLPLRARVADFDGDGHVDLAFAINDESDAPTMYVVFGAGNGRFDATPTEIPLPETDGLCLYPGQVAAADLDNDGNLDLTVGCRGFNTIFTARNMGERVFDTPVATPLGTEPSAGTTLISVGSIDQDGMPDLAVADLGGESYWLVQGTGSFDGTEGPLVDVGTLPPTNINAITDLAFADIDGADSAQSNARYDDIILSGASADADRVSILWTIATP